MKILLIAPYITSSCHPAFLRNQTGFGYMVYDIAHYVAKTDNIDVYAPMAFTPEIKVGGFKVIKRNRWSFLKGMRLRNIIDGIAFNHKYKQPLKMCLRSLYIFASIGQVESMMKQYDIVHLHGCSELTDAAIKACQRQGTPFLVTLHGLNSFEQTIKQNEGLRRYERDFLKESVKMHYPVSFISTGNMKTAEDYIGIKAANFYVINNGCNIHMKPMTMDIRREYDIASSDFVFAFVGNVSMNKNQVQVARAWMLLPDELRLKCKVLFVGRYDEDDELVKIIRNNHQENSLILCGIQPKEKVANYFYACDATILTSITEGFGLSIIEGFVYGKPNVTFADLPATLDLYDEGVMVVSENRTDQALAQAMVETMHKSFNTSYIREYVHRFSFEKMAKSYLNLYKEVIQ